MPDICDVVLEDHEQLRRGFAQLDDLRASGASAEDLGAVWQPLGDHLDLHAAAEEEIFYPELLSVGRRAEEETDDAIKDHNQIRDAVARAAGEAPGSDGWWAAVTAARKANSDHIAEEERGALADLRATASPEQRQRLGTAWAVFHGRHRDGRNIDRTDKSPERYVQDNT